MPKASIQVAKRDLERPSKAKSGTKTVRGGMLGEWFMQYRNGSFSRKPSRYGEDADMLIRGIKT
jgi:hypothetical protein